MAQTFDIRFAKSAGLAGLFEAPANEFRWKGAGRLSIDATGISIAVRRGLLTLFGGALSRRFAPDSLVEVYREGNALRLEFSTREAPRTVLPVWVNDRNAAEQIVTLLPTRRSVELEDVGPGSTRRYRIDRRVVALLLFGVAMLVVGVLLLQRNFAEDPAASQAESARSFAQPPDNAAIAPSVSATSVDVGPPTPDSRTSGARVPPRERGRRYVDPAQAPETTTNAPSDFAATTFATDGREADAGNNPSVMSGNAGDGSSVATAPVKTAHQIAVEQYAIFLTESNALRADFLYWREYGYQGLSFQKRWMAVTTRIVNTEEFAGIQLYALREFELAVARNWRDYFSIRDERGDGKLAAAHLAFVEELEAQLPEYAP